MVDFQSTLKTLVGLNIKNSETCRLAAELAELTGETKTGAITVALRERLERERRERGHEQRLSNIRAVSRRCAALLKPGVSAVEHGDLLYNESGLPK